MDPVTFNRGPADTVKVFLVYVVAVPMAVLGAGFAGALLFGWLAAELGAAGEVCLAIWGFAFLVPLVWAVSWGAVRYRRWSIDQIRIGGDRIEWFRKERRWEMLFDDLSMVRFEQWVTRVRSRNGDSLVLRGPTWPMREMQAVLLERALPRMTQRLVGCLEGGERLSFSAPLRKAMLSLFLGFTSLWCSPLYAVAALGLAKGGAIIHAAYVGATGLILFGGGLLSLGKFLQLYGHRIEMDRAGIRLFSLPKWRRISWDELRVVGIDKEAIRVADREFRRARIDSELDNFEVIRRLVLQLAPAGEQS